MGFLIKKSLSGRKAFVKSLGEFIAEKHDKQPNVNREEKRKQLEELRLQKQLEREKR